MSMFNIFRSKVLRPLWNDSLSCFIPNGFRDIHNSYPLGFNTTPYLMAMPIKRKRKIDPAVLKLREERKKKKIEKEIRKLKKMTKTLKPIEESRTPYCLYKDKERRARNIKLTNDMEEKRYEIKKKWNQISDMSNKLVYKDITKIILSQQQALDELQKESVELYNAAIQADPNFLPFSFEGPTETPPIENYSFPDGEYNDISKKWLDD